MDKTSTRHPFIIHDDLSDKEVSINNITNITKIESDVFVGELLIRVAGLDDTDTEYFKGKRRKSQILIQGRFKRLLRSSDFLTGQRFNRKFTNIPASWMIEKAFNIVKYMSPLLIAEPFCDKPYFYAPIIHASQTMRVDMPSNAPSMISELAIMEDTRLFGKPFDNGDIGDLGTSASCRRKYIAKHPELMDKIHFDPKYVYTFQFYDHILDLVSFSLDFGFGMRAHLFKYLQGQPIHILACVKLDDVGKMESDEQSKEKQESKTISSSSSNSVVVDANGKEIALVDAWKISIAHELNKDN